MTLPRNPITPIRDDEPNATPALWNSRYEEIDQNFTNLDGRQSSVEAEISAARTGKASVADAIGAIVTQLGGISGTLNGMASPVGVQNAVNLDWLYSNHRFAIEFFMQGYTLQNHPGTSVISGVMGDDSLDVADTSGFKIGEDYLLSDAATTVLVRVTAIHSGSRMRLSANLLRTWGATARLTGSTLTARSEGGVNAVAGAQWVSRAINLGADETLRAVVIRRSESSGELQLFSREASTNSWISRWWVLRRPGGGTSGVPEGFTDYEYLLPMQGDGYLRLQTTGEAMVIRHIVGLGSGTGLGGERNPLLRPSVPTLSRPRAGETNIPETPTLSASNYVSPSGIAFATAQFQISSSATYSFDNPLHDSGEKPAMTYSVPAGVLAAATTFYLRCRVKDVLGMVSDWSSAISFRTKETYAYVNTPIIATPTNGQTEIPARYTIQTSAFSTTGGTDTHATTLWQIRQAVGSWTNPIYNTAHATYKTYLTIPASLLADGQTQYVVRVRHTGTALGNSEWSSEVTFTTKQLFAQIIGIVCTAVGGGAGSWQRIDESYDAIATTTATFNNHPTYAGVIEQAIDGQAMVRVPKFYVKTGTVPSGTYEGRRYWMIADRPVPGFSVHPAFMNAGAEIAQYWVGKYQAAADNPSKLASVPGPLPLVSTDFTTMQARASARNTGGITGFGMWSIYQLAAIQMLALIEMGGADSQSLIGRGNVSGTLLAVDNATVAQATWRGIVGLWGNIWQMVDGLQTDANSRYTILDKNGNRTYQPTATRPVAGLSAYTTTMAADDGVNYDLGMVFAPSTADPTFSNGTYGDLFLQYSGCLACHGGGYSNGNGAGLFALLFNSAAGGTSGDRGSRLAKV
ncbi:hypothetical protein D5039_00040 [Verminephrobacter aporrectodeae subsp. tuberculatae]|uniref:Minor tail protein n=1 Tax=Verminephrobacter aporrectodeae subsp. tuberculatae TaxID=1110392 RepID=A0ABT3KNU6_9BURK|nr:hypothetical protein [Verminephrobacter aporrectodeae]MCW5319624.1 hypothetical protein [Verminephrobacter aporrectodeae subsp. tuberculatae]